MKILYVITGLGGGGAEKVVCDLADQMALNGHKVKIAYLTGGVVVYPKRDDIELVPLNLRYLSDIFGASSNYKKLLSLFNPDIVHAHMVHANIFARLNRIFYPIPRLICTAHSNNEGGRLRMLAYRLTNGLSEVLTNVSQGASQHFEKLGAVKVGGIRTVYNGINLDAYSFNVENSKLNENLFFTQDYLSFLSVGRFHEAKDYPNLLYAIALLRQKINQNIMFYIAGDGELRYQVENLIQNLQLEDCVQLLGRRDDIPQLMNQTDFFILSSKYEGFGLVVAEAMACGAFVIATDCGGVGEVMGNTGILVSPENSEALAQAIQQAIALPVTDIVVNKEKARQRVEEKFSLESSVKTWLEIYEAK